MSKTPHLFVLPSLNSSQVPTVLYGEEDWGETLSRVVAANVKRHTSGRSAVVLRPGSGPRLAIAGWFSSAEASHLRTAIPWFVDALSRLQYVDYAQVEADCIRLGEVLQERFPSGFLEDASFIGIPRGGTVVLGLLSYVLDLDHSQVDPQDLGGGPLVVVDDCFLSGARLSRFLENHPSSSPAVAAGLYAHPELRAAVEREEPLVQACLSARDLTDYAPSLYGEDYEAWKSRWDRRTTNEQFWVGITEQLCFPWSEPDSGIWNAEADETDPAWTVAPSDQCLDRQNGKQSEGEDLVQIQHSTSALITVAPDVFYASFSDRVLVGGPELDACLELEGTAADFWTALVTCETISEAKAALQRKYDIESERLASDLRTFVKTLIDRQLLETGSVDALHF